MKTPVNNNMICDIHTGSCDTVTSTVLPKVKMIYFTDPICSACWGIEPQLRKLKLEYGDHFEIEYRMGGLLKSWQSYGGNDVSGPASVADHWEEAAKHYQMPIDANVWREDPLQSSYPASIAFKAAQLQDEQKAIKLLRRLREMVFVEKKNIAKGGNILQAAEECGLDTQQLMVDYAGRATAFFEEDLEITKQWGVRGFPTIYFTSEDGSKLKLYGSSSYEQYETALLQLLPGITKKVLKDDDAIFQSYSTIAEKELAVIRETGLDKAIHDLHLMKEAGTFSKISTPYGSLWKKIA